MEPSKAPGCGANLRQKWRELRGGKPKKQSNRDEGPSMKNESTSPVRYDSSKTSAEDKSESAGSAKAVEDNGLFSPTETTTQESPPEDDHALDRSDQKVTSPEWLTTIHNALWNKAYSNLKQDPKKAKYVEAYEKLVLAVFLDTPISDEAGEGDRKKPDDPPSNLGEERMKAIVANGLARVEGSKKVMEKINDVSGVFTEVKAFLDIPLKNIPQTALPWAVISSTVDILVKPAKAAADLYNGVAYVVSRMSWYSKAVDKLLSDENIKGNKSLAEMNHDLEKAIVDLYQSMLFYQVTSVCSYYKSQLLVLLRGFLNLDDWSGDLAAVKDAENALQNNITFYNQEHIKDQIRHVTMTSEHQKELDEYRDCLQALRWIDPRAEIGDIQARNENIIEDLYKWILLTEEYRQFSKWGRPTPARLWVSGQAGTGKTMLLIGIIKDLIARGLPDAERPQVLYFFCQATNNQANNGVAVLRSLIWLLLLEQPHLISHIQKEYFHSNNKLFTDKNAFTTLCGIFRKMLEDKSLKRAIIIIDALDECEEDGRELLASFIDEVSSAQELFDIKWLISSRPLPEIPASVQDVTLRTHSLLKLDGHDMSHSINRYIDIKMVQLRDKARKKNRVEEIADKLKAQASNTYIWVSLVCRELLHTHEFMWTEIVNKIPKKLEGLYGYLLDRLANLDSELMSTCCKNVLTAAMLARDPLALSEIEILAGLPEGEDAAEAIVQECRSFLTIRNSTVYLIHQSAQDYLQKHYQKLYDVSLATLHHQMYERALSGLKQNLRENIYRLSHYGVASAEVQIPNPDPLVSIRYACRYWVYHLEQSGSTPTDMEDILFFLNKHFLHWLEAMSLLGSFPDIVSLLCQLISISETRNEPKLSNFLMDAERFVLQNLPVATAAPLQLYVSCLTFSPKLSQVRRTFEEKVRKWILRTSATDTEWGALLQTLEHSAFVNSVAFAPDGQLVASGSDDRTVKLWDTATGSVQKILSHPSRVCSVAFSPDNKLLASGSGDGPYFDGSTIRLWDTGTWSETERLQVSDSTHLTFSPDSQLLVSASSGGVVALWKRGTRSPKWERQHWNAVLPRGPIAFSPNGQLLAAAGETSDPSTRIVLLDIGTCTVVQKLDYSNIITSVAFSPDNRLLACVSGETATLLDTATWSIKHTFLHRYNLLSAAFSPDSELFAARSDDDTVLLWNIQTGTLAQTLRHHGNLFRAVEFSPDGQLIASGSVDSTVKLWKVTSGRQEQSLDCHTEWIRGMIISPNGLLLATYPYGYGVRLWNTENGKLERVLESHPYPIQTVAFSPNSKLLALCGINTVMIWNTKNGEQIWKFDSGGETLTGINFFADNKLLASVSSDHRCCVWDTETGHLEQVGAHHYEAYMPNEFRGSSSAQGKGDGSYEISVKGEWVIINQKRSIWLPPEYRPFAGQDEYWAVRENTLMIGAHADSVLFMWFDPVAMVKLLG